MDWPGTEAGTAGTAQLLLLLLLPPNPAWFTCLLRSLPFFELKV